MAKIPDIELTGAAMMQLQKSVEQKSSGCLGVRLSVREAGCSGLEYVMDYATRPEPGDYVKQYDGFCLCIDEGAYEKALRGLRLDYQQDALSSGFVFSNPNKTGECGCGQSFTV